MADLLRREKTEDLSPEETWELEHYLQLEHLMRLARARAQPHLTGESFVATSSPSFADRTTRGEGPGRGV